MRVSNRIIPPSEIYLTAHLPVVRTTLVGIFLGPLFKGPLIITLYVLI